MKILEGFLSRLVTLASLLFVAFHLATPILGFFPNIIQRSIHLSFGLIVIFGGMMLLRLAEGRRLNWLWAIAVIVVVALWANGYIVENYGVYIVDPMNTNTVDTTAALFIAAAVLICSGLSVGWALTVISVVLWVYTMFGYLVPGIWGHAGFDLGTILQTAYHTTNGIYGDVLGISATTVAVFVIFGVILFEIGAADVLLDVAKWMAGPATGGTAKMALLSSSFFGMINGNATANAASTGSVTIPMMTSSGVPPRLAAAVEAVASSGGQIVPPILGAAAFLMAEFLGVPYIVVVEAAVLPALLYYASAFATIHFEAVKLGLKGIDRSEIPLKHHLFQPRRWLPLVCAAGVLAGFFATGFTLEFAGAAAVLTVLSVKVVLEAIGEPDDPHGFGMRMARLGATLRQAIMRAAQVGAQIAVLLACAQLLIMFINMTGIGVKVVNVIVNASGGELLIGGLLSVIVGLILGTGLPTTAEYVLAAAVVAPALTNLGAVPLAAHMFVFYYAVLATLTPPVGASSFITAGIAKVPWIPVSFTACRLALPSFFIPLLFLYHPEFLSITADPVAWVVGGVTAILGVVTVMAGVMGAFRFRLGPMYRILAICGGAALLFPSLLSSAIGFVLCVFAFAHQFRRQNGDILPNGR